MSEINFLGIIQVLVAIAMTGFILIQRGPGATAGSAFGGGASGTVFGAKGSGSFLTKATAILATAFFIITMLIAIDSSQTYSSAGDEIEQDLGVFGDLDEADIEPSMSTTEEVDTDAAELTRQEAVGVEVIENAADEVKQATNDAIDAVDAAADDVAEEVEDAIESDDSDGNDN